MMVEDFYHSNLFLVIGLLLLIGIIVSFIFNVIRFSTKKRLRVCGFGHPLLDITTHVDSDFLDRYGLKPADTMLAMDHHKPALYHELIDRDDVQYGPGGATLNSVRACQWLLRGKGRTGYVGCIGDDEFGELLKREVEKSKVEAALETIDDAPTGTCGCMILGKERCLVANLGASQRFSPNWFNRNNIREQLEKADIYFIAGFFLNLVYPSTDIIDNDPKLFPALYIAKHAAKHNKIFCMNLSAPYLCTAFKDKWEVLMPYIDYLFGSEVDYLALSEAFGWKVKDIHEILERCVQLPKLNSNRPRIAVVTRGALPTVVRSPERFREYPTPFVHLTHIQDLNGAGDAFVGGFLAVLASGGNINECMRTAQYTASQVIRQPGCTFPSKCRFSYSLLHFITDSWRDHVNGKL